MESLKKIKDEPIAKPETYDERTARRETEITEESRHADGLNFELRQAELDANEDARAAREWGAMKSGSPEARIEMERRCKAKVGLATAEVGPESLPPNLGAVTPVALEAEGFCHSCDRIVACNIRQLCPRCGARDAISMVDDEARARASARSIMEHAESGVRGPPQRDPGSSPVAPGVPGALPQAPGPQGKAEDAQEEWAEIAEEEEEARELTIAADVTKPCLEEVEKHNVTHIPYRRWCDCCVEGRGIGEQRGRPSSRDRLRPTARRRRAPRRSVCARQRPNRP